MATVNVTPEWVRGTAGRLRGLKEAFEALEDSVEGHTTVGVSGDPRVGRRLWDFGDNWYDRRAEMAEAMQALADLLVDAATAYEQTDLGAGRPYRGSG
jgi:uncharacterized protein YukE